MRRLQFDHAQERVDDLGIELPGALPFDFGDGLGDRPGRLVRPLLRQRIEHVGHRDDAADERDLVADADDSRAVPALVMAEGDLLGQPAGPGRLPERMRAPIVVCVLTTSYSSWVSLPSFSRMLSGMPILPMSCSGAARRISDT